MPAALTPFRSDFPNHDAAHQPGAKTAQPQIPERNLNKRGHGGACQRCSHARQNGGRSLGRSCL